jgi:hypothetical protein
VLKQREITAAMQTIFENAIQYVEPPQERTPVAAPADAVAEPILKEAAVDRAPEPPIPAETPQDIEDQVLESLAELGIDVDPVDGPREPATIVEDAEDGGCIPLEAAFEYDESSGVQVIRKLPPDDNDMIVIVDDQRSETPLRSSGGIGHRQEYRQLFSRLRRS